MSFGSRSDQFHAAATAICGWDDFGGDDYFEALRQYCTALDANRQLSEAGKTVVEQQIIGYLRGRLYSEHYKREHPEYQRQRIEQPLIIIGLPRSGTSALHKMLAADPQNQALEYWLGQTPMPRPPRELWPEYAEFRGCLDTLAMTAQVAPELFAIHRMAADEADECRLLLAQSFANVSLQSGSEVPDYEQWLYRTDFAPVYQRYRDNLRLIGLNDNARWVLKDPSHLWAPQTLLETFPDVCIVQTHRHPARLLPSVASLVYAASRLTAPELDKATIGRRELKQWARVLDNLTTLRRERPELAVHDLRVEDLQRDPLTAVEGIYAHFDMPFDEHSRTAVAAWTATRPASAHPPHQYSAEDFGLSEAEINEAFADYIDYFELEY